MRKWAWRFIPAIGLLLALGARAWGGVQLSAGWPLVGSPKYINGGMHALDRFELPDDEDAIGGGVIDEAAGYAYFGANHSDGDTRIHKIHLGDGETTPRLVATIPLDVRNLIFTKGMIDPQAGVAWFAGETPEAGVSLLVTIALGQGEEAPRLAGTTELPLDEIRSGMIDGRGYAYLGGNAQGQGLIAKVALRTSDTLPRLIGTVPVEEDEWGPRCSAIDPEAGYLWLGIRSVPPRIVKYSLGEGEALPARVGAVEIEPEWGRLSSLVIDRQGRFGIAGTEVYGSDGWAIKVDLGAGAEPPQVTGAVRLGAGDGNIQRNLGCLAADGRQALFATDHNPARVVKVAFGDGASTPTLKGTLELEPGEQLISCVLGDSRTGMAYLGTETSPAARVIKIGFGGEDEPARRISALTLPGGERNLRCVLTDPRHGYAYYGTDAHPARIIKVRLGGLTDPPRRLGALVLNDGENDARCGLIDPEAGVAWFGMGTSPGRIVKVALGQGDALPTRLGALTLEPGEDVPACAVFHPSRQLALWGLLTSPGQVVKVDLGQGEAPPARIGVVTLSAQESMVRCAVADPVSGHAWFGAGGMPGRIVKLRFGEGYELSQRMGALALTEEGDLHSAFIDADTGYAWFKGFSGSRAINSLTKVALGGPDELPKRLGGIQLSTDSSSPVETVAVKGASGKYGYAVGGYPGGYYVLKMSLGDGDDPPSLYDRLYVPDLQGIACAAVYPYTEDGYFGNIRVRLSSRNQIHATRVKMPEAGLVTTISLYTHASGANLRLGLYDASTTPTLLWQSPGTLASRQEGWVRVAPQSGTGGGILLAAGEYWLAWQADARFFTTVSSLGSSGSGFYLKHPFGAFPGRIEPVGTGDVTKTQEVFSCGLSYTVPEINFNMLDQVWARNTTQTLEVALSEVAPTTASVRVKVGRCNATNGVDYQFTPTVVTFAPGETRKRLHFTVYEDKVYEPDEFIAFLLTDPVSARLGSRTTLIHTISSTEEAEAQAVRLAGDAMVVEGQHPYAWLTIQASGTGIEEPIEVDVETVECGEAVSGEDFEPYHQRIRFPTGNRAVAIPIGILQDTLAEAPERFLVKISNPSGALPGANTCATVTIVDPAAGPVVPYLLGLSGEASGLDFNKDGKVDIVDEIFRMRSR